MSSDKRIYKRYLVENVEMCKRTKQRRDCENESSYDGSGPSQAVERRHSEINREISSDSEEFYSNDNTRESYQASDTDSEDCLTEDDISMDMQCEYEGNNLPFDNDLVQDEELSSNIEEQEENIRLEKDLLYPGANITEEESELLILAYVLRHGISDKGLEDLLTLINCHTPTPVYKSKYCFLKKFPSFSSETIKHYYCSECSGSINFSSENGATAICDECQFLNSKDYLDDQQMYFYTMPLENQIKHLLEDPEVLSQIGKHGNVSDIVHGELYKKLVSDKVISDKDLTIQFNTDGARVFKSAQKSLWPVQVLINELPFSVRNDKPILTGIWFGKGSPRMDTFLEPFVNELQKLHTEGFTIICNEETRNIKVHCILASVDSVARPKLQNMIQFNGKYGCPFCYNKGKTVDKGKGKSQIYLPYRGQERTEKEVIKDAMKATKSQKIVRGVKGPSILALLPVFNIVWSMAPEYMHSVLLGVVKMFTCAWFDSVNHEKPWYLRHKIAEIDKKMLKIKPPCEVTRIPASIEQRCLWKASQWRAFLLYYSLPVLKGLLPETYLRHWLLLVYSFYNLLQDKISNISECKYALDKFVMNVKDLYGIEFLTFNVHLLLHFPKYVNDFGAPWASSAFTYETGNGCLVRLVRGTKSVPSQVCKYYNCMRYLQRVGPGVFENSTSLLKHSFKSWMGDFYNVKRVFQIGNLTVFGNFYQVHLTISQQVAIKDCLNSNIGTSAKGYKRFVWKGVLYHSILYDRLKKRENTIVVLSDGTFMEIQHLLQIDLLDCKTEFVVIGISFLESNYILCKEQKISSSFIKRVYKGQTVCHLLSSLQKKCVKIVIDNEIYLCPLVNSLERD